MRKSAYSYIMAVVVMAVLCSVVAVRDSYAAQGENKVVRFFKNVFNWPFGVTKKSSEAVGRTTKRAAQTVTTTGSSAVHAVTGRPEKFKDVVVEPVKGSAETAYTAAEGAIRAPIEATEEAFE